jgi:hypothetical protein
MSFGQRLGGAMQQFQAAKIAEEERRQKAAMQALQAQLINAQIGETQAQAKQREAEAAKLQQAALRAQQFQSDLSKAGTVSPSAALAGGGGPTQANAANIGASRPIDWQALAIQYPDQIKAIEELAKARNFGRDKVARTVKGLGPDGREYEYQVDDYGNKVGAGMAQYRAPIEIGQGDRKTFADAYNLNPLASFAINQSPDSKASNAVAWANNAIARDRLGWEKQKDARDASAGQLVETPDGYVRVGKDNRATAIMAPTGVQPLMGNSSKLPEAAQKQVLGARNVQQAVSDYQAKLKDWSNMKMLSPDARAEMGNAYNNMMLQAKEAYNLGVLNGPDYAILQSVVKDPTKWTSAAVSNEAMSKQATELARIAANIEKNSMQAHGKQYKPFIPNAPVSGVKFLGFE